MDGWINGWIIDGEMEDGLMDKQRRARWMDGLMDK